MMTMKIMRELSVYTIMIHFARQHALRRNAGKPDSLAHVAKQRRYYFTIVIYGVKDYETMSKKAADIIAAQLI